MTRRSFFAGLMPVLAAFGLGRCAMTPIPVPAAVAAPVVPSPPCSGDVSLTLADMQRRLNYYNGKLAEAVMSTPKVPWRANLRGSAPLSDEEYVAQLEARFAKIAKQYREGRMAEVSGFNWFMDRDGTQYAWQLVGDPETKIRVIR